MKLRSFCEKISFFYVAQVVLLSLLLCDVVSLRADETVEQQLTLTPQERQWLKDNQSIRFTGDPNWLPFEAFDKQGNYIGIVAAHLDLIEKQLGIRFEKIVTKTWTESVNLAKSGEVDILSETDDSALKSHLLFTDYYVTNPVVIVMKIHQNFVEDLNQIQDKKIGVIRDYGYVTKITNKYQNHQFAIVEDIQDGLLAVSTGRVDALLCTVTLCGYTMSQLSLHDVKVVGKTEFDTRLSFGVNKSKSPLVPILNKAIANISQQQRQSILDDWALQEYVEKTDYSLVWKLSIGALIILGFLIYRQRELRDYNKKITLSEKRLARIVRGTSDGVWDWNIETNEKYFSPKFESMLGYAEKSLGGSEDPFFDLVHPDDLQSVKLALSEHLVNNSPYDVELRVRRKSGEYQWFRTSGKAVRDEQGNALLMAGCLSDISGRKQRESLDSSRNQILELIAKDAPFVEVLNAIIANIELEDPKMIGSILLLDNQGKHFSQVIAPGLPDFFNQAVEGIEIGDGVGCCGTAAYTGKRVIVENIQSHPYWKDAAELASAAKLKSCWSEPIFDKQNNIVGTFAIYHQMPVKPTENQLALIEQAANLASIAIAKHRTNEELQLASLVYQNSSEAMLIFNAHRQIISVNPAFSKITGYSNDEVLGQTADILNSSLHDKAFYQQMSEQVNATGFWQGEVKDRRKNGEMYVKWLIVNTIFDREGNVHRRLSLFSDITEKKQSEETIWKQANFDFLTGLPNRNMFHDRLAREIKQSKRDSLRFAMLLIDLDHFKEVNDTLGHDMGDVLLVEAAKRIRHAVRETDIVARLGGDEFIVIISGINKLKHVERAAQSMIEMLSKPFQLAEETAYISASIGVTLYPDDASDIDGLLKNADQAMYESKNLGRNRYRYFTASMQHAAQQRMYLIAELRQAIELDQFVLSFQPIVELVSGRVHKAEALIRWQHPEKGLINPARFIPVAEETGLIVSLGEWVLNQATHQVKAWRELYDASFQLSVNTSPMQYQANEFNFKAWSEGIKKLPLAGDAIIIEITESLMMDASDPVQQQILAFRNSGIQVALDDFGTGYSSLSYLKKLDIDYIKIDKVFVKNLQTDENDRALCEAIVVMAHKLKLKVVAEGVETEQQKSILLEMGCDYAQGYAFSEPLTKESFEKRYLSVAKVS